MAKLVDILAIELEAWHSSAESSASQDADRDIAFYSERDQLIHPEGFSWNGNSYISGSLIGLKELADDYRSAKVTRSQWQAAVDALNDIDPAQWTGEGLPPIGIDFEWRYGDHAWKPGRALYIGSVYAILAASDFEQHYYLRDMQFRPARTPEQIEAEARDKTIADLKSVFDSISHELCPTSNQYLKTLFGAIHDRGYRKLEITDES